MKVFGADQTQTREPGCDFQSLEVTEQALGEVGAERFPLEVVKQRTGDQVVTGFSSKLDGHEPPPRPVSRPQRATLWEQDRAAAASPE